MGYFFFLYVGALASLSEGRFLFMFGNVWKAFYTSRDSHMTTSTN